jgi:hypothetical protein
MALLIKADGTTTTIAPRDGKRFTIEEMQKLVDGYVQVVKTKAGELLICDEDGKPRGKPLNAEATKLYEYGNHSPIVGDVIVCARKEAKL